VIPSYDNATSRAIKGWLASVVMVAVAIIAAILIHAQPTIVTGIVIAVVSAGRNPGWIPVAASLFIVPVMRSWWQRWRATGRSWSREF